MSRQWSATANRKPGLWRHPGISTNSSVRIRDGAVLPILHLNGYKINNPTLLARVSHEELENLFRGYGWTPHFVEGSDPDSMHQAMAATTEHCVSEILRTAQRSPRSRRGRAAALADDRPAHS